MFQNKIHPMEVMMSCIRSMCHSAKFHLTNNRTLLENFFKTKLFLRIFRSLTTPSTSNSEKTPQADEKLAPQHWHRLPSCQSAIKPAVIRIHSQTKIENKLFWSIPVVSQSLR